MPDVNASEYGPFDDEREALATRSAALIRAAFDANPGVGASVPECLRILTDACDAAGVALGNWDRGFLKGVAWGETADTVSLAGMITRAYQAGVAAQRPEGTVTEWGVRYTHKPALFPEDPAETRVDRGADRETALRTLTDPKYRALSGDEVLVCREITPWTPADEPSTRETGEGDD